MRIESISIKNFRSFRNGTVDLNAYTSLVGPNGAGKSTVLCALNIFFREAEGSTTHVSALEAEDFHACDTSAPIEITVTFTGLSENAQEDFAEYFRQNKLVITAQAVFDHTSGVANVKQFGQRLAMEPFKEFFELYNAGKSATELKSAYTKIRENF